MISSEQRCKGILNLIDKKNYFVIHAARQSGKTTLLKDLVKKLNKTKKYYALYCSLESASRIIDPEKGIPAIVKTIKRYITFDQILSKYPFAIDADYDDFTNVLLTSLVLLCKELDKPLVIFFDETDCLTNGTLITFLRQLRDGYINRDTIPFVHSIGLIGMRNIRDYKDRIREVKQTLGSASPFNIVTEALTLKDFTEEELKSLYAQHENETGQIFPDNLVQKIFYYCQGQPWLANAIARDIVEKKLENDYTKDIKIEFVDQAVQNIINRRDTHIDSLLERLKEDRVKKVVEPTITGAFSGYNPLDDDFQYVIDLGLLKDDDGHFKPSNPIYSEVIVGSLSNPAQRHIDKTKYPVKSYFVDNNIDMKKLLTDFQIFWRENSAIWKEKYHYKEAAPHLVLMAFLQRIVNSGGHIYRELASETGRLDLCVDYKNIKYPIELKIRYKAQTYTEGKTQLAEYMDSLGCNEGWLIVFDKRTSVSWKKKLFWRTATVEGMKIHTIGC
jgi:hypothetical protein